MAFVLIDEKLNGSERRLASSPHVAAIEVPLPDEKERAAFVRAATTPPLGRDLASFSDFDAAELATLTAGISLADLNVLIQSADENGQRLDATVFRALKKRLIERQCHDLLEFIEPKWTLDTVVGHEAAKKRLRAGRRAAEARRARHAADGLSALRPGRHRQVVPGPVRQRRNRHPLRRSSRTSARSTSAKPKATWNACCPCCVRWARWSW